MGILYKFPKKHKTKKESKRKQTLSASDRLCLEFDRQYKEILDGLKEMIDKVNSGQKISRRHFLEFIKKNRCRMEDICFDFDDTGEDCPLLRRCFDTQLWAYDCGYLTLEEMRELRWLMDKEDTESNTTISKVDPKNKKPSK
jgi:hypothetical protein